MKAATKPYWGKLGVVIRSSTQPLTNVRKYYIIAIISPESTIHIDTVHNLFLFG